MILPSIAALAAKHNITAKKYLGQNFLFDSNLCDKIVAAADINSDAHILEIGPGTAGLTRAILAKKVEKLILIEADHNFAPLLQEIKILYPQLEIHFADALQLSLSSLLTGAAQQKFTIISNLPYNIGTNLLLKWFEQLPFIDNMTLMFQKEVAERLIAQPGEKSYGRLSIIAQLNCQVKKYFDVSPKAFTPPPKIWSSIVGLKPREDRPEITLLKKVQIVTRLAFTKRRKMLKSSLRALDPSIAKLLGNIDINPELRAENLSPLDYLKISQSIILTE